MHPHRAGHYESPDETIALLALASGPVTDSGLNVVSTPLTNLAQQVVAENGTVTVAVGDFILIWTSINFEGAAGAGTNLLEQTIVDQTSFVWDTVFQTVTANQDTIIARAIRLGPVGHLGQPAPGTYKFAVNALLANAIPPGGIVAVPSIVVMRTHG